MVYEEGSFRDPAGQVIVDNGIYLRRINPSYRDEYNQLMYSGLYGDLVGKGLMVPHIERKLEGGVLEIKPAQIAFISYPYEWCFSMLKEAALNTLEINRAALEHGMMLKDASAYNMQWYKNKMTLIDTLSFMRYTGNQPWYAYRQFLNHFLAPLLLMKYQSVSGKLLEVFLDGIPVEVAATFLPWRLRLSPSMLAHIYAQTMAKGKESTKEVTMPRRNLEALLESLEGTVRGLKYKPESEWSLYDSCSYTETAYGSKQVIVSGMLDNISGKTLCDFGANVGKFSALAQGKGYDVIGLDNDHDCVEYMYLEQLDIFPLILDICNPSPGIGWENKERKSFLGRLNVDTIMMLALLHHICIGNNTPVGKVAEMLSGHCKNLIIEYVPLDDPKAKLLASHKVFPSYSKELFEAEFLRYFKIVGEKKIEDSCRSVYLMSAR